MRDNEQELIEKLISKKELFQGHVFNVELQTVQLSNGAIATREVVRHNGGAGIVALDTDDHIMMIRQFRAPYAKVIYEIPAGKLEIAEEPLLCAQRELAEETGYSAKEWSILAEIYPSPGYVSEQLYIYLARDLTKGRAKPDANEFLNVERIALQTALNMIEAGEINDAKTIVGILRAKQYLEKER